MKKLEFKGFMRDFIGFFDGLKWDFLMGFCWNFMWEFMWDFMQDFM